MMETMYF